MTHRTIFGLTFKVHSPSNLELVADPDPRADIALVSLAFSRDVYHNSSRGGWRIHVLMKRGHTIIRGPFTSRDEAIALIAGRRTHVA